MPWMMERSTETESLWTTPSPRARAAEGAAEVVLEVVSEEVSEDVAVDGVVSEAEGAAGAAASGEDVEEEEEAAASEEEEAVGINQSSDAFIRDTDFRIFQPLGDDPCDSCRSELFLGGGVGWLLHDD